MKYDADVSASAVHEAVQEGVGLIHSTWRPPGISLPSIDTELQEV